MNLLTSPAPWKTKVWSKSLFLVIFRAAKTPATATEAVPERQKKNTCEKCDDSPQEHFSPLFYLKTLWRPEYSVLKANIVAPAASWSNMVKYIKITESCECLGTLDVVVEGAVSIPVLVEDAKGVAVGEILKLYQTVHPVPAGRQS